ncbi:hypothetical protein [Prochlorococcus sp. MIT 1307]|uniref:hypothetical protein n=1 Tax=Prochlorococcus sp. MIT 1307 TaxID=3096219 RepID=UPI002A747F5E|nr:hypothetical protein [Prochlorococcus sp. MIT 1307]
MLTTNNRLLVKEILHRLEIKEPVTVNELIYLHQQASEYEEVDCWVKKLLSSDEFVEPELKATSPPIAA